jgi:hypothetical protein|tara:strand:+ start:574 stop:828 length:255 start_codon:yes stop_codon:yes gene_type:complete
MILLRASIANWDLKDIVDIGRDRLKQPHTVAACQAEGIGGVSQGIMLQYIAQCHDEEQNNQTEELTKYWRENISSVRRTPNDIR